MTAQIREKFDFQFSIDSERELARVIFQDRPGLSTMLTKNFDLQIAQVGNNAVELIGHETSYAKFKEAFTMLAGAMGAGQHITKGLIKNITEQFDPMARSKPASDFTQAATPYRKAELKPLTENHRLLAQMIEDKELTLAVGPAGTAKTHTAVAKAIEYLKAGKVKKILLARPAQEAGEKIGFLPGSADDKLAPFMRPIYDMLDEAFGFGKYQDMIEKGIIEIAPIGFMRGRTFKDSFVIIDEAQNCTAEQLKMATTRIGDRCKTVVTGDAEQSDLEGKESGLVTFMKKLEALNPADIPLIGIQRLTGADIVRSELTKQVLSVWDTPAAPDSEKKPKVVAFPRP